MALLLEYSYPNGTIKAFSNQLLNLLIFFVSLTSGTSSRKHLKIHMSSYTSLQILLQAIMQPSKQ